MFCDKTTVKFIGGKGGDGCVSFRREKFVAKGGPDGGDGGRGANIILKVNENINTLSEFNKYKQFAAENGTHGQSSNRTGRSGEDLILDVPKGTIILDPETEEPITDLKTPGQEFTIVRGGKGGLGNARFVTSVHQAPKFAEHGEKGQEKIFTLELNLVADIGIIGLPSAGKSTLISQISNAKPKIAEYHFTTLIPNLGVVEMSKFGGSSDQTLVVADIPGLIPGAHEGKGLGHEFLRHISRTHILVHLLDGTLDNIVENFDDINKELDLYDQKAKNGISKEEQIVVLNKIDSLIPEITEEKITELESAHPELKGKIHTISAATGEGLKELAWAIYEAKQNLPEPEPEVESTEEEYKVFRPHLEKRHNQFDIELISEEEFRPSEDELLTGEDPRPRIRKTFKITGPRIEQITNMTDFQNYEAIERIYNYIEKTGILKALKKSGAQTNDILLISDKTLKFRK